MVLELCCGAGRWHHKTAAAAVVAIAVVTNHTKVVHQDFALSHSTLNLTAYSGAQYHIVNV